MTASTSTTRSGSPDDGFVSGGPAAASVSTEPTDAALESARLRGWRLSAGVLVVEAFLAAFFLAAVFLAVVFSAVVFWTGSVLGCSSPLSSPADVSVTGSLSLTAACPPTIAT